MINYVKTKAEDGRFTIGYAARPHQPIGFWLFAADEEQRVDHLVNAMNGAYQEGIEDAIKRMGTLTVANLFKLGK